MSDNYFPTEYQSYIHKSRYARWLPDQNRRETWIETVSRYFDFFEEHLLENNKYKFTKELRKELEDAVLSLEIMPSMRCLMTAGEALKRENVAGYNCSFIAIDGPRSFDEILYVLMNGTGVGFSVEQKFVDQLPIVAEEFHDSDTTIVVADSKLGWAKALKELIHLLFGGQVPKWDVSKVRPAGAPLKTFGGRSSGPDPLVSLFKFCVSVFKRASGRRLTTLECHDIVCKIAEVVVVGGVRRSALISLSDLSDDRMRAAKSGDWWKENPQRALANNSFVAKEKDIDVGIFMDEWKSLYESRSGERGIFSRYSAQQQAAKFGRREDNFDYGVNPCCLVGDTKILTKEYGEITLARVIDLVNAGEKIHVGGYDHNIGFPAFTKVLAGKLTRPNAELIRITIKTNCNEEKKLDITPDHLVFTGNRGYVPASELKWFDELWYSIRENSAFEKTTLYFVERIDNQDTFDIQTETENFFANNILVHNSEIILRNREFCNLTEVIVRGTDTQETLARKIRLASILGTIQSTLTNFKYLSKKWKENCEEERLLGVSLTGIMDNQYTNGTAFYGETRSFEIEKFLSELRQVAVDTNLEYSKLLKIPQSAAITCVKPSGTVSQLVDAASGIHARHSPYYIRTVRADKKDPLAKMMIDMGFPAEDDVMKPDHTYVFSFPIKSPENAIYRKDMSAIDQLELWLVYQKAWCEHKPSITVSIKEHEWLDVGAWVFNHYSEISGVSFLPFSDHVYQQAPYQDCTKEEYEALLAKMPKDIDWNQLSKYEKMDTTIGSQELACSAAGGCEI